MRAKGPGGRPRRWDGAQVRLLEVNNAFRNAVGSLEAGEVGRDCVAFALMLHCMEMDWIAPQTRTVNAMHFGPIDANRVNTPIPGSQRDGTTMGRSPPQDA